MEHQYTYQQRRSRSQPRLHQQQQQQQPSPAYRSPDLDYPASGAGGSYFGASGSAGYFGGESRPWRSRSLDNRRDWVVSSDYGFPAGGPDDRYTTGGTVKQHHQQHQQRNYDYQPYLSVSTVPTAGYRGTYDGRRGNDPYFDVAAAPYSPRSVPPESDWDALDRSIRNYREDPGAAQIAATMRRSKAQSGIVAREEVEFGVDQGATSANYYRGGGGSSSHQQEFYGPTAATMPEVGSGTMRGRTIARGGGNMRYGPEMEQKYYKLRCCCLSFRWPPWALEEVEPPQPMYRRT
ncbi:unnamed protein product [Gongylonema pulchrum]|uniref:Uncharacterized protein n=1 Tax=Gongylonema pulchrum TaxID=637853 RepID=A0A183EI66_9BILA|nr:unnamed protein product [Gongylonema pulchrum]